ncbi:MAG: hypothetical protein IJU23_10135 [Proteobacteria bacterium]|nr:hypothetical protein [Pseudomonadota bacterium]
MTKKLMISLLTVVSSLLLCSIAFADGDCITVNGNTICGYDCKFANGTAACAKTQYGVCTIANKGVYCWDPPEWVHKKGSCIVINSEPACGFECRIASGKARCASTPFGVCTAPDGHVQCWDPPRGVQKKAQCVVFNGEAACGYDCKIASGKGQCAKTPEGKCQIWDSEVTCTDPVR